MKVATCALLIILLTGLSGCSREVLYENFYEGFRIRNQLETGPSDHPMEGDSMSYQRYQRERKNQQTSPADAE